MKSKLLLLTCAILLACAGVASAQMPATDPPAPGTSTALATTNAEISVTGKVVSWTSSELLIETSPGERMTFALDPKGLPAATFAVGERVTVRYHSLSGGTVFQVSNVALEPIAKAEPLVKAELQPRAEPNSYEVAAPADPQLPQTASGLPLMALFGLLAAGGAVVVRVVRS